MNRISFCVKDVKNLYLFRNFINNSVIPENSASVNFLFREKFTAFRIFFREISQRADKNFYFIYEFSSIGFGIFCNEIIHFIQRNERVLAVRYFFFLSSHESMIASAS